MLIVAGEKNIFRAVVTPIISRDAAEDDENQALAPYLKKAGVAAYSHAVAAVVDRVLDIIETVFLKEGGIGFKPELPSAKRRSISRLGMGLLDKVYLQFDRPFWDKDVTWIYTPEAGGERGQFNVWLNFYKTHGVPIIMAFNGGSAAHALAHQSDQAVISQATKVIRSAYSA